MDMKTIIQCLIIVLVVALACAAIYAGEAGEVSDVESSHNQDGLYISGSGNVCPVNSNSSLAHHFHHVDTIELHI